MTLDEKIAAWLEGDLEDEDLTRAEWDEFLARVNAAVVKKVLARDGVHTFGQHRTLQ